jgi:predicted DNA-binding protein (MmcQ/YjbR family)
MTVDELRAFVLSLPDAAESSHQGGPDFRYRNKIVVNLDDSDATITIKLDLDEQAALFALDHHAFTAPGGWAKHGWTTISLAMVPDDQLRELITAAWNDTIARFPRSR